MTRSGSNNLMITAGESLSFVYFNGNIQNIPNYGDVNLIDTIPLPNSVTIIAVWAQNNNFYGGILASDTDGRVLTNSAWVCNTRCLTGWQQTNFDDSKWVAASENADNNGTGVFPPIAAIRKEAKWIWNPKYIQPGGDNSLCCRSKIGPPSTNTPTAKQRRSIPQRHCLISLLYYCYFDTA